MKLLYISEDYIGSKVHHQLLTRFADRGLDVSVFTIERASQRDVNISDTYASVNYNVYSFSLSRLAEFPYRFLFPFKCRLKYNKLIDKVALKDIDFVHAATVFSEGAIAYKLYKKYGIPYSVAVRATDLDLYLAKMPYLWKLGQSILFNASKIIIVSPLLKQKFFDRPVIKNIAPDIEHKCVIIPNGIEDFWINNTRLRSTESNPSQVLYIGRFDDNKNVESLVKAVLDLKQDFPDLHLSLVGGSGANHNRILEYCRKYSDALTYHGKVFDKDRLLDIMRSNHIFAMVSHSETFGLVYLEALSQGLPILYTSGHGIDQSVPCQVGEKADSYDQSDITDKLRKLITGYNSYKQADITAFSWDSIASEYISIFKEKSIS